MSQPNPTAHHLTPELSQQIFDTQILPQDITPIPPSQTPTKPYALLTLGQTGAGKTLLVPPLLRSLHDHGRQPAHLIADVYKTFHPEYHVLPAGVASRVCSADARIWLEMAVRAGCEKGVDMLIESACRHPDDFIALVKILREKGYHVVIVLLATPYALSRLGILVRYFEQLPESGSRGLGVRLTPVKVHDDSYEGLMKACEWLDGNGGMVDRCVLVRRGGLVGFVAGRGKGAIQGGVAEALRKERGRPLTGTERKVVKEGVERLERLPEADGGLKEVRMLLEPLLAQEVAEGEYPELTPLNVESEDDILGMMVSGAYD